MGAFYLTPKLELKSAGSDTNVFNAETAPVSDATIVLSPSLEAALPLGNRFRFTARGFVDFTWFRDFTSERSTDRGFRFRGETDWGRLTFFGETGRARRKQRFTIDLDERLPYNERTASAGVLVRAARKLTAGFSVTGSSFDLDATSSSSIAVERSLDRSGRILGANVSYALTPRTSLVASAESIRDRFDQAIGSAGREVTSKRYLAGFSFGTRSFLNGRVEAGVRKAPVDSSSAAPGYDTPVLKAELALPFSHVARLKLTGEREIYYSAQAGVSDAAPARNSFVSKRYGAELSAEFPFDLVGRVFAVRQGADYYLPYATEEDLLARDARLNIYGFSLLRAFGESLKIGGGVSWDRRASTLPGGGYRATRYGFQAEYVP
jgi:hypothetical protein